MERWIRASIGTRIRIGVSEHAAICAQTILHVVAQDAVFVETIETIRAGAARDAQRASAEELLEFLHHAEEADALVHIDVVEVTRRKTAIACDRVVVVGYSRDDLRLTAI